MTFLRHWKKFDIIMIVLIDLLLVTSGHVYLGECAVCYATLSASKYAVRNLQYIYC